MISRREMNSALAMAVTALFSGSASRLLQGQETAHSGAQEFKPSSNKVDTLMQEPLPPMPNPEAIVVTLTVPPGAVSKPHEHIGPVFAYILEGEIENQVDPNPPQRYKEGQFFYEPRMHVHRSMRNLSKTQHAKLLIFEVSEKDKAFTIAPM